MTDKKVLSDSEIKKVAGGKLKHTNSDRQLGQIVNIDSNDPHCPFCKVPLEFNFAIPNTLQHMFWCPSCDRDYVKDMYYGTTTWAIDDGEGSGS